MTYRLNQALCEALGIEAKNVTATTLRLRLGRAPTLTVQSILLNEGQVKPITQRFELRALDEPKRHSDVAAPTAQAQTFAVVVFADGCRLIVPFDELPDILLYEEYRRVEHVVMTPAEYDALPEFEG